MNIFFTDVSRKEEFIFGRQLIGIFWILEWICRVAYQKKIKLLLYREVNSGELKKKKGRRHSLGKFTAYGYFRRNGFGLITFLSDTQEVKDSKIQPGICVHS